MSNTRQILTIVLLATGIVANIWIIIDKVQDYKKDLKNG